MWKINFLKYNSLIIAWNSFRIIFASMEMLKESVNIFSSYCFVFFGLKLYKIPQTENNSG